jgi:hypothetical protein
MSEALIVAVLNAVGPVGIEATVAILKGMKNASTISDAIAALESTLKLRAVDFEEKTQ